MSVVEGGVSGPGLDCGASVVEGHRQGALRSPTVSVDRYRDLLVGVGGQVERAAGCGRVVVLSYGAERVCAMGHCDAVSAVTVRVVDLHGVCSR